MTKAALAELQLARRDLAALRSGVAGLHRWYAGAARELPWRSSTDPYAVWVSEVMLQQTQVVTAWPYYLRWLQRFATIADLAAADESEVLLLWQGLGYYSRARNFHRAARVVVEQHQGEIPGSRDALAALPGVGAYTSAAVASIAFGEPVAVIDGNVRRVLCRLIALEREPAAVGPALAELAQGLLDPHAPATHNQALMELGALVCRPRTADCPRCPFGGGDSPPICRAARGTDPLRYPLRKKKKVSPHHHHAVALVRRGERLFFCQRPYGGLLAGMWDFPNARLEKTDVADHALRRSLRERFGLDVEPEAELGQVDHVFSHLKVTLHPVVFRLERESRRAASPPPLNVRWVEPSEFGGQPMSRATLKVLERYRVLRLPKEEIR